MTDQLTPSQFYQAEGVEDWRLTSEKDALNNTASYVYNADNNRTQVTDKRGYATDFAYDTTGNVTLITDPLDFARSFTYDSRNNMLSETDPRGYTTGTGIYLAWPRRSVRTLAPAAIAFRDWLIDEARGISGTDFVDYDAIWQQ